jgi:putative transposase
MTCGAATCALRRANTGNRALGASIVNRSRPPTKGGHGYDAHKHVKGRKRHILVDTLGLLLAVAVTAARVPDRDGGIGLLEVLRHQFSRLWLLWADQAYAGGLRAWLWALRPWRKIRLEIVKRPEGRQGFQLLPQRWKVERTFGWFGRYRRLAKD